MATQKMSLIGLAASMLVSMMSSVDSFQQPAARKIRSVQSSKLGMVAVDPSTLTKKDYDDIIGASFDDKTMFERLEKQTYLYPKHVEVINDIAPIAGAMVDEIVSEPIVAWTSILNCISHIPCSSFWKLARKPGNLRTSSPI